MKVIIDYIETVALIIVALMFLLSMPIIDLLSRIRGDK